MKSLDKKSKILRKFIIDMIKVRKGGHLGPALSLVEILYVLYEHILKINPKKPNWSDRDRLIFSKGHGCLALYAILAEKGFIKKSELSTFCQPDSILGGHPERNKVPGVEASTGSLGHGLPIAVGISLASKLKKKKFKTFVVLGDGEMNEGSNWEALMTSHKHKLDNMTIIIDRNHLQSYGKTKEILDIEPLRDKLASFGAIVKTVDGHDIKKLKKTLSKLPFKKNHVSALICNTIKGKGLKFAENNGSWHHKSNLNNEEIETMYKMIK
tara:strand:- start:634 stop:1440 length:807 start_codon:yes stop_codon:yes gene_type:complete